MRAVGLLLILVLSIRETLLPNVTCAHTVVFVCS